MRLEASYIGLVWVCILVFCPGCGDPTVFEVAEVSMISATGAADYEYVIPVGAGLAIDRGEGLDIFPAQLDTRVGETIRIVNHDDRGHLVGPFFVGASETLTQRFSAAGEFVGECTVHPSGQVKMVVSE